MPLPQARAGDDEELVLGRGVDGSGQGACPDAVGPADEGEEDGFGEELHADGASVGSQGAAESDLGAAFKDGDDHDVGHPDRADEEGRCAETQEEIVEGALGLGLGHEGGRWLADVDLTRVLRVCGGAQEDVDAVDVAGLRA
jgi:hypothetical protein